MILVTGAAGKTGRALLQALLTKGVKVRALVHSYDQVHLARHFGASEVVVGDMGDRRIWAQTMYGVKTVYHICPNMSPYEVLFGRLAIEVAEMSGVQHFVFHSVLHPQTQKMPHHWLKLRVEEILFESKLPFTILQPAIYMQNILAYWKSVTEQGVYKVPYQPSTRLNLVDLQDVAEAAAIVLTEPGHFGAIYELAGIDTLTQYQVAEILSSVLGVSVRAERMPIDEWKVSVSEEGMADYQIRTLVRMFSYYEHYGFWGNPNTLSWLLGRKPNSFSNFVRRCKVTGVELAE